MKLLIISSMWPSKKKPSYGIFVKNFMKEMELSGVSVDIVANSDPRTGILNSLRKYFLLLVKAARYRGNPEIVQAEFVFPSGLIACLLPKFRRAGKVLVFHGSDAYLWKKLPFGKSIYRKIIQSSDAVIFPSEFLKDEAAVFSPQLNDTNVQIIPRGITESFLKPVDKREARQKLRISEDKFLILSVGNLISIKDHLTILKAAELINMGKLTIVLVGDGPLRSEIERYAEKAGLEVILPGSVSENDLVNWYTASDIFVAPSLRESYGIALREAMAMGLAVIASDIPPHREVIVEGKNGLIFKTKEKKELFEKIGLLLKNPELRKKLGNNARMSTNIITMKDTAEKYYELYKELIGMEV